jgi:hypothetical protein
MTIEELGSIGELLAAVATLVTVIYLALQIRQTTSLLKLSATKNTQDDADRWRAYLIENKDITQLYRTGMTSPESLDADDRLRFRMLLDQLFYGWQAQYLNDTAGSDANREYWRQTLTTPGGREHWASCRNRVEPAFRDYIDQLEAEKSEA